MEQEVVKLYEIDQIPNRDLYGKYCLLPYVRLFAECDDFEDELIVKVIKETYGNKT